MKLIRSQPISLKKYSNSPEQFHSLPRRTVFGISGSDSDSESLALFSNSLDPPDGDESASSSSTGIGTAVDLLRIQYMNISKQQQHDGSLFLHCGSR